MSSRSETGAVPTLPLAAEYLPAVLTGRKVTTVRSGRRNYRPGPYRLRSGGREVDIHVDGTRHCRLAELDDRDAHRDGFESLAELQAALRRFYPHLGPGDTVTVVEFRLAESAT